MKNKYQFLSSFILKIIVVITMTLDHLGIFLLHYFNDNAAISLTGDIFRIFGRITLPLIAILFAEAMKHTHDQEHYLSRLGLMAVIVLVFEVIIYYVLNINLVEGNIFLTLLCSGLFIYFLNAKDNRRFLLIIPIAIVILSFISDVMKTDSFYPNYLKAQYSLYGFILCVGSYFIYKITDNRVLEITGNTKDLSTLQTYPYYRSFTNLLWCALITIVTVFFWLISYINAAADMYNISIQSYAMLSIIPIIFYNGKKGYQSKIIQYSFYAYYPLHILIIFLSFYLALGAPPIGW